MSPVYRSGPGEKKNLATRSRLGLKRWNEGSGCFRELHTLGAEAPGCGATLCRTCRAGPSGRGPCPGGERRPAWRQGARSTSSRLTVEQPLALTFLCICRETHTSFPSTFQTPEPKKSLTAINQGSLTAVNAGSPCIRQQPQGDLHAVTTRATAISDRKVTGIWPQSGQIPVTLYPLFGTTSPRSGGISCLA